MLKELYALLVEDGGWIRFSPGYIESEKEHYLITVFGGRYLTLCGEYYSIHPPEQITPGMIPDKCEECKRIEGTYLFKPIIKTG